MVAAAPSHAVTIGDLRGGVVIGRSFDVSIPILLGSGEEVLASCLSAEVFFGDAQQVSSLTVSPGTAGPAPTALVRIRSNAFVDEPVVSLMLRSSCGGATSRRYVVLSDFPASDFLRAESAAAAANASHAPPAALAVPQHSATTANAASGATASSSESHDGAPTKAARRAVKKPATRVKHAPSTEAAVTKSVLILDPQPFLRIQGDVPMPAALPASAAASAPGEEVVQQALPIQALQNDVKTLKELAAKNQASLMEFQAKLRQAEAERVPMSWFFLVVALLLAALGALGWLLRKQQKVQKGDWWQHAQNDGKEAQVIAPASTLQPAAPATDFGKFVATRMPSIMTEVHSTQVEPEPELDIDLNSLSTAGNKAQTASVPLAVESLDEFGAGHNINLEAISDIRQQAEFFVSLGQSDRALSILRKQILESTEPNPLVYLDLLSLYHSLGLKTDFRELRSAFNQFFNVVVPDFPAYNLEGRDLLEYADPLAVLARFWPNIEAIAFLEACIFHNNAAPMQLSFDLAAFRDLLMLHAVAEKVTSDSPWKNTSNGGLGASSLAHAEMAELAMTMRGPFEDAITEPASQEAEETRGGSIEFAPSVSVAAPLAHGLDLDFDLDEPSAIPDAQNPKRNSGGPGNSPFRNSLF